MDIQKENAENIAKKSFWGKVLRWGLFAATGYCAGLATLPFGARPFGFAILCSARFCAIPTLAGVILSCIGGARSPLYIAAYLAVFIIRIAVSAITASIGKKNDRKFLLSSFFSEPTVLCALNAAVFAFLFSLYYVIKGGFLLYDVYASLINTGVSALAVLIWRQYTLEAEADNSPLIKKPDSEAGGAYLLYLLGFFSLSATVALGADGISLFGISISVLLTMLITFAAVKYGSISQGALVGALCGIAIDPLLAPSFVFAAVVFGFLSPISIFLGTLGAFAVSLWWGFYSVGISSLTSLLPAMLIASILFTVLDGLLAKKDIPAEHTSAPENTSSSVSAQEILTGEVLSFRDRASNGALQKFSSGLDALSEELYAISDEFSAEKKDVYRICESAFDAVCSSCTERDACRADCEFSEEISIIGGEIRRGERARNSSVGEKLRGRCARLPDILDEINYSATLWNGIEREREQTEFFALDYKTLATLASSCESELTHELLTNARSDAMAKKLSDELDGAAVAVIGRRRLSAIISFECGALSDSEILSALKKACGVEFALTSSREENGFCSKIYEQTPRLSVSFDARSANAAGECDFCGDTYGVVQNESSARFIAFISDGMGCGREASEASRTAAAFLRSLLPLSYGCEPTVNLLNSFLRRRGNGNLRECSVSIDLADIDLVRSKAIFCKSGAAPTYVLRGGSVFKIRARTIPIGIISEVDIKRVELDLKIGDIIVMVSDGVTQGKEECPRLFELLSSNKSADPKRIAELVLKYALDSGTKDDVSVLVLRID